MSWLQEVTAIAMKAAMPNRRASTMASLVSGEWCGFSELWRWPPVRNSKTCPLWSAKTLPPARRIRKARHFRQKPCKRHHRYMRLIRPGDHFKQAEAWGRLLLPILTDVLAIGHLARRRYGTSPSRERGSAASRHSSQVKSPPPASFFPQPHITPCFGRESRRFVLALCAAINSLARSVGSLPSAIKTRTLRSNGSCGSGSSAAFTFMMSRSSRERTVGYDTEYSRASSFSEPEARTNRLMNWRSSSLSSANQLGIFRAMCRVILA